MSTPCTAADDDDRNWVEFNGQANEKNERTNNEY